MPSLKWLLYGAYGHTGRLIVEEIQRTSQHRRPVRFVRPFRRSWAGRNHTGLDKLCPTLDCHRRVFDLDNLDEIVRQINDVDAVLNCAGPFSATAVPMIEGLYGRWSALPRYYRRDRRH